MSTTNYCCVCGEMTFHAPDNYGDYYCSPECWSRDTGQPVPCQDCGKAECDCCWEEFYRDNDCPECRYPMKAGEKAMEI